MSNLARADGNARDREGETPAEPPAVSGSAGASPSRPKLRVLSRDESRSVPKVVVITGASAGIGAAVAREASRLGYLLAITARRGDRLETLAEELRRNGTRVEVIPADLNDYGSPEWIVSETLRRFGRLDVIINNAGLGLPTLFSESKPDEIRKQLEVNLVAPLLLIRHAIPSLIESRGMIINIGSAISCLPNPALGAYGATKAGLAYFNDALRREIGHRGVRVCLVEPGPVKTEFFDAFTKLGPEPGTYHPMLDSPSPWMSADVGIVAQRIVKLIERPKRRLSVRRRFVWPWRIVGFTFQIMPWLGDFVVGSVLKKYERLPVATTSDRNRT